MKINTNISSLNIRNYLLQQNKSLVEAMERLSGRKNLKYLLKEMSVSEIYEDVILPSKFQDIIAYIQQLESLETSEAKELIEKIKKTEKFRLKLLLNEEGDENGN